MDQFGLKWSQMHCVTLYAELRVEWCVCQVRDVGMQVQLVSAVRTLQLAFRMRLALVSS